MTFDLKTCAKTIIMILIMLIIGNLPPISQITELGMKILGVFIGIIFGWICIDILWVSLFGVVALSLTGYMPLLQILGAGIGNTTVDMILFSAIFAGLIEKTNCIQIVNKWLLTRKKLLKILGFYY